MKSIHNSNPPHKIPRVLQEGNSFIPSAAKVRHPHIDTHSSIQLRAPPSRIGLGPASPESPLSFAPGALVLRSPALLFYYSLRHRLPVLPCFCFVRNPVEFL